MVKITKKETRANTKDRTELVSAVRADVDKEALLVPASAIQMRRAMRDAGILDKVESVLSLMGEVDVETWEYSTKFIRREPFIERLAGAANIPGEEMDKIFRAAIKL